jgi:hypothetical protein
MRAVPRDNETPTLRQMQIPVALIVGGTEELISSFGEAAVSVQVLVAECSVADAATTAAQLRPLVLVMNDDIYQFDAEGFEALARDVRSRVMRVPTPVPAPAELEAQLTALMQEAENERPSWSPDI